jgi:alkanesulfonate monooxygenase SsuD/methylene tetrahydromethanopterin reductase-like flavin-dependent oxidoreductase (luciferase family)
MKIDLFMEFAAPPMSVRKGRSVFEDGFALARAADAAGFDTVWAVEHHFLGAYSHAAAPDMLLAAIARETQDIGLGFGVVPLPLHDPVRVAERFATLDLISGGRLRWGVGRGVTVTELEGFGVSPSDSRDVFRERLEALRNVLGTGAFERDGVSYELEPDPRRVRKDGWLAAVSPETFDLAAALGLGAMAGPFKPWPMVRADLARYRRLHPGGETSFAIAVYCEPDGAAARRRAEPGLVWAYRKILEIARPLLARQISGYEHYRKLGRITGLLDRTISLRLLEALGLTVVGDPSRVARKLASLQASGLDRVSLIIGGGDLDVRESIDCIELLAGDVLPRLAEPETAREAVPA